MLERYAGGHGHAPGREHVGGEKRRRKPVEAFSGGRPTLFPSAAGFVRPGRSWAAWGVAPALGPASSFLAVGDPRLAAVIVGSGEAGQLAGLVGVARPPSLLAFNLRPSRPAPAVEVGHGAGKPLFLLNLLFSGL